ncbi:MAG TPA: hypothetical protein VFX59_09515 [Polyangiales bacterium]|nr:hypothetical protein [Polyangiales bacterium]
MRGFAVAQRARPIGGTRLRTCVVLCALLAPSSLARAQEIEADLRALRDAVEHAQFERAASEARGLLARLDLHAHQRNDTLELLAIAQIAARDEAGAQGTLQELYSRDPEHTAKLRDPGPQVEAAFARVRVSPRSAPSVPVETAAVRDVHGRTRIEVTLGAGRDAVESVDVFASAAGESMHLVAEVARTAKLALTLPELNPELLAEREPKLTLYVEARAPSGYVLGRDGTHEAPLQVRLDPPREAPLRRQWWVWTSAAIAVAGIAIGSAIAAH